MKPDMSVIFGNEPAQWGLRGDPWFWEELREQSTGRDFPWHADEVVEFVCREFESVSGIPLTCDARPFVAKYAHGGMSSGYLSGLYWIGRGMARILENYYAAEKTMDRRRGES